MTDHTTPSPDLPDRQFPHVSASKLRIIDTYGDHLQNTGGNDPRKMLEDLATDDKLMRHNEVYAMLAIAVSSQIALLARLERAGLLPDPNVKQAATIDHFTTKMGCAVQVLPCAGGARLVLRVVVGPTEYHYRQAEVLLTDAEKALLREALA